MAGPLQELGELFARLKQSGLAPPASHTVKDARKVLDDNYNGIIHTVGPKRYMQLLDVIGGFEGALADLAEEQKRAEETRGEIEARFKRVPLDAALHYLKDEGWKKEDWFRQEGKVASKLEREWWGKTAGVVEYAIAVLKGKNAAGFWQAQILESTDQNDLGRIWAVSEAEVHNIWHKAIPFLGKYTQEGEFITPIPLTKVRA